MEMEYPKINNGIKFYNYYFYGIDKPLIIEARNKDEARDTMERILPSLSPKYRLTKIIGETVVVPLLGVSEKMVKGVKYIWVGLNKSRNGWLTEQQYQRELERSRKK
jgi:hypothetical protein